MDEFFECFTEGEDKNSRTGQPQKPKVGLVVLGNGFDLQCGLHTSYREFFEYCESSKDFDGTGSVYNELERLLQYNTKDDAPNGKDIFNIMIKHPEYSVWDIYFVTNKNGNQYQSWNWLDVENAMEYSLAIDRCWENVSRFFKQYREHNFVSEDFNSNNYININAVMAAILYSRYILDERSGVSAALGKSLDRVFYEALLADLSRFEERFGKFIREQYEAVESKYDEVAEENIVAIYKKGLEELNIDESEAVLRVISFNYIPLLDKKSNHDYVLNIHNTLDTPIFGISEISSAFSKDHSLIECFNLFNKENRENNDAIKKIVHFIPENYSDVYVFTYGLSFTNIDEYDFRNIFYDKSKKKFHFTRCMYPDLNNNKKENVFTKDIVSNIKKLIKKFAPNLSEADLSNLFDNLTFELVSLPMMEMEK